MTRRLVSSGSRLESDIGYSRAVVDNEWAFVSGTTGYDYSTMTISDDVVVQCEQTMRNIESALTRAGASMADCSHPLHSTEPRRLRVLLPNFKEVSWRSASRRNPVTGRAGGSKNANRDRNWLGQPRWLRRRGVR